MNDPSPSVMQSGTRWQAGDWLFRVGVPAYIAFGAAMKLFTGRPLQLPIVSLERDPSVELERWAAVALPVLAAVELALAGVILLGGRWTRWLALAVMLAFAGVLVPHVRAEAASCGCFGAVDTNPTLMLITALSAAALIALLPCSGEPLKVKSRTRVVGGWVGASALVVAAVTMLHVPERLGWRVPMMRLRPETWTGMKVTDLPFYSQVEGEQGAGGGPPRFSEPEQTWVLWLRTCPHCHEYFRERWGNQTTARVVAIELPPSARGVSPQPHTIDCPSCVRMHLRSGTFYFLPSTPVVLTVRDGVVAAVDINPAPAPSPSTPNDQEQP